MTVESDYSDDHLAVDISLIDYRGKVRIAYNGTEAIQLNTSKNAISDFLDTVLEKTNVGDGEDKMIGVVVATAEGDLVDITIKEEFLLPKYR